MDDKTYSFLKNANMAVMIFYIILSVVTAVMGISSILAGMNLNYVSEHLLNLPEYSQDDVTGGFDVIARLLGGGLSIVIAVVLILIRIAMLFMLGLCISMVVSGIRCNGVLKVPGALNMKRIRSSSIFKLVINSLFLLGSIILCVGDPSVFGGVCITMILGFEVLLIIMLVKLSSNVSSGVV